MICASEHQNLQIVLLKLNKHEYFPPTKVLGRGNETQLQVGENFNNLN